MRALLHARWGVMLLCSALLFGVQVRIHTSVCGNDPMLYQRAARTLLQPELYGAEAVRQALTFVAPGYTLLLAGVIKIFGDLAPYWLNLVLLLAALPLMWFVFRRIMGSDRAAGFSLLGLWIIVFGGYELNAPFLLYPFRETPVILCSFAAYAVLLRAIEARRPILLAMIAGLLVIVACSFREPSVLMIPGLLLGLLALPSPRNVRWRLACGFLVPWFALVALGAVVFVMLGYAGSSQFEATRYLRGTEVAWMRIQQMLPWIPSQAGWIGAALIALGVARAARRSPVLLAWFLLPAVLLFVFYAFMQMHNRYFLSAFFYLAVIAGYGLDGLLRAVESRLARWTWLPRFATAVVLMVMIGLMVQIVNQAKPWGPRVTAAEIREWQARVGQLDVGADGRLHVAVEQRHRYLEDFLLSYTDAQLLDPKDMDDWPTGWAPAYTFRHLNSKALYATPQWLMYLKIYAHRLIAHRANLIPVATDSAWAMGGGKYELYRITPLTAGRHEQPVQLAAGQDQVIWLDWGRAATSAVREVTLTDPTGIETWKHWTCEGRGLQALVVPAEQARQSSAMLRVESADALPDQPVQSVVAAGADFPISFGTDRSMSANDLFPDIEPDNQERHPLTLRGDHEKIYQPPRVYAPEGYAVRSRFLLHTGGTAGHSLVSRDSAGRVVNQAMVIEKENGVAEVETSQPVHIRIDPMNADGGPHWLVFEIAIAVNKK